MKIQALVELEKKIAAAQGNELLASDFLEFGRSGKTYDRADIIRTLEGGKPHRFSKFKLRTLAPGLFLLTYRTLNPGPRGTWIKPALRSSIWKRTRSGFQLLFHQATPTK